MDEREGRLGPSLCVTCSVSSPHMGGSDCFKSTWLGIPGNPGAAKQIPGIHRDLGVTQDSQGKPESPAHCLAG